MCSNALDSRENPAVSPMSGCPTFNVDKKKQKRGEFKTPPRPTGRRSNEHVRKRNLCHLEVADKIRSVTPKPNTIRLHNSKRFEQNSRLLKRRLVIKNWFF